MHAGKLIIITAPSGAGKTTIVHHLLNKIPDLEFSVSATTRQMRDTETNGIDYYFLSEQEFLQKIKDNELIEWQEVYPGKYYGTLKKEISRLWKEKKHIVFDVDVKGAINLKNLYPLETLSIFIKPPSLAILEERLKKRATESPENLAARIERARLELSYEGTFDNIIVNDDLAIAKEQAYNLVLKFIAGK